MTEEVSRRSLELFESGFFCAESILLAIAEHRNITSDIIPGIATGFCSGISRTSGICGAVTGAIMGINLACGRKSPEESVERNYTAVQQLIETFEKRFGSTNCRQLIGCDLNTPAGQHRFESNNLITRCRRFVEEASKMAMEQIDRMADER